MKNPEHAKYFEDVDVDNLGFGALGGGAIENHERAGAKPRREGVVVSVNCQHCGTPNRMTIEWPEAIIISAGAIPQGWEYHEGYIRPRVGCGSCKHLVSPGITPDEAARWVRAGINAKFVNAQQAQQIVNQARAGRV